MSPLGAGAARRGDTSVSPLLESLYLTVVLALPPPSPAGPHLPGLGPPAALQEGCGEEGLHQAVQGAPSPTGQCYGLHSPRCRDRPFMGLPLQTDFPALLALLGLFPTAYVKEFAFPDGPSSTPWARGGGGLMWGRNLVAMEHGKPEGLVWAGQLAGRRPGCCG